MRWLWSHDGSDFLSRRRGVLLESESRHCLAWAAVQRSLSAAPGDPSFRFLTCEEEAGSTAHAILDPRRDSLILSAMRKPEAESLAELLHAESAALSLVEGPAESARWLAEGWTQRTGGSFCVELEQALHELREVQHPSPEGGQLKLAGPEHTSLLMQYLDGFMRDCFPLQQASRERVAKRTRRLVDEKKGFLWQCRDGDLVSMAALVRETPSTASISLVYTPPRHRRKGHAARVVAALSQAQLDAGKRACNLHTDLSNPTSNRVYYRLGYRELQRGLRLRLTASKAQTSSEQA